MPYQKRERDASQSRQEAGLEEETGEGRGRGEGEGRGGGVIEPLSGKELKEGVHLPGNHRNQTVSYCGS